MKLHLTTLTAEQTPERLHNITSDRNYETTPDYPDSRQIAERLCNITERIACIHFMEFGALLANLRINAIYNICNICKYNHYMYILFKMLQTLSYLGLKLCAKSVD